MAAKAKWATAAKFASREIFWVLQLELSASGLATRFPDRHANHSFGPIVSICGR